MSRGWQYRPLLMCLRADGSRVLVPSSGHTHADGKRPERSDADSKGPC